jgi:type IV pilus assembly protein PilE
MAQARTATGFTLIEIAIALAIVAITTTFAVASYRRHIIRSDRVEAVQALLAIAAEQEKFHLSSGFYGGQLDAVRGAEPPGIPVASLTPRGRYRLRVDAADAAGFVAIAERVDRSADPDCVTLSIDESGRRRAGDVVNRDTTPLCW